MAKITMKSEEQINKNKLKSLLKTHSVAWTERERGRREKREKEREREKERWKGAAKSQAA